MTTTKILVVEDEALFSDLLRRTLESDPGLEIVGDAQDGETAICVAHWSLTPALK